MSGVPVIGRGPAGLSTAPFTANNGLETTVSDGDEDVVDAAMTMETSAEALFGSVADTE